VLGVRVELAGDHAFDARRKERVDARWRGAMVRARLERHVDRGTARALTGDRERDDLGVRTALPLVPALADDLVA
jgi:hypothetical protein